MTKTFLLPTGLDRILEVVTERLRVVSLEDLIGRHHQVGSDSFWGQFEVLALVRRMIVECQETQSNRPEGKNFD